MKSLKSLMLATFLCLPSFAAAQTTACDQLEGDAKATAQKVMQTAYLYDCCDDTIQKCLSTQPQCKLAKTLADETCRLAAAGKSADDIKHALEQRAMVMASILPPAKIAVLPDHVWGNPKAKTVLSIYLCGRCPFCSRHVPELIHALENSPLKDKVAINLRLFPIKSHENSSQAAIAVEAAAKLGLAWPYLLKSYENFDSFSLDKINEWAASVGADPQKFEALINDSAVRAAVVDAKKEGLTNSVESTPTFFLNGHKIQSAYDLKTILSMLEESAAKD
ncbi:MAG: thioredoxin domain-containing protein [Proteobacteria bacterium]|nr:thioredoxin domain-containing protein [Pseudomonadota bacterium]